MHNNNIMHSHSKSKRIILLLCDNIINLYSVIKRKKISLVLTAYDFCWVELTLEELTELPDVHPGLVDGPSILRGGGGGGTFITSHGRVLGGGGGKITIIKTTIYTTYRKIIISILKNTRFSGKGRQSLIHVMRIREMLISYVRLDHILYSINYGMRYYKSEHTNH